MSRLVPLLLALSATIVRASDDELKVTREICAGVGYEDQQKKDQFYSAKGDNYQILNNVWGDKSKGSQCLNVYNKGERFDIVWEFPDDEFQVNSYPHVKFQPKILNKKLELGEVEQLQMRAEWGLAAGDVRGQDIFGSFNEGDLSKTGVRANVAIDIFCDKDKDKSKDATKAGYEIMVWLGRFGTPEYPQPLGWKDKTWTHDIGDETYTLYSGKNQRGLTAFTWIPEGNTTKFDVDYAPLIRFLVDENLLPRDILLGLIEFGQETFYSSDKVTFAVRDFQIGINEKSASGVDAAPALAGDVNTLVTRVLLALGFGLFAALAF